MIENDFKVAVNRDFIHVLEILRIIKGKDLSLDQDGLTSAHERRKNGDKKQKNAK